VTLAMYMLQINRIKALRFLKEAYDPASFNPSDHSTVSELERFFEKRRKTVEDPYDIVLDEELIDDYAIDWAQVEGEIEGDIPESLEYMINRGFSSEALNAWEFGYDEVTDRIVFPVRDDIGRLVGFKARAWRDGQRPKYLNLGDSPGKPENRKRFGFPTHLKSRYVFGMNKALEMARAVGDDAVDQLIVCEGELNAIALWDKGFENSVAVNGSDLSKQQADIFRKYADELLLFFDSDRAGHEGIWGWTDEDDRFHPGVVTKLLPFIRIKIVPVHDGDPATMSYSEINKCIEEAQSARALQMITHEARQSARILPQQ